MNSMRSLFTTALGAVICLTMSCQQSNEHQHAEEAKTPAPDTTVAEATATGAKSLAPAYAGLDAKVSTPLHEAVAHYFHLKNALVDDKSADAQQGATAMVASLKNVDKSYFTAEQKKAYDAMEKGLKDHAAQIAATADIKVQRAHFVELSNSVYELVKAFGAGKTVYHDFCPMANDDKGALWVSEVADIKNPYFGSAMLTCGSVEEKIN